MAAVARETKGAVTRADMADVESYARGDFLLDLVKGQADTAATTRLADKVAALTGIDQAREPQAGRALRRGRIPPRIRPEERQGDGTLRRVGHGHRSLSGFELLSFQRSLRRAVARAADQRRGRPHHAQAQLAAGRLLSNLLNGAVEKAWDFGHGISPPESVSELRQILALDPKLKLLIGARAVRSGHAVFRHPRSSSTSCRPLPRPIG